MKIKRDKDEPKNKKLTLDGLRKRFFAWHFGNFGADIVEQVDKSFGYDTDTAYANLDDREHRLLHKRVARELVDCSSRVDWKLRGK